ncbi:MAG: dipeptidase PepE [Bacteroidales bacterium]|nr:dipeptidase PepE [Bacteroidales bacterium]
MKRLLLFSNSTNAGEEYLTYPLPHIKDFLKNSKTHSIAFIPFAAVTFSFDEYEHKVNQRFGEIGLKVRSVHRETKPVEFIKNADVIVVGGGNTFHLLKHIYEYNLIDIVRQKVNNGTPYIGWSAGSNMACPTICTTNDMPIVQPPSFEAFNLIPFQINPHYLDANPDGHAGETREQRILEFLAANPTKHVLGLREGCWLLVDNNTITLHGSKTARIFKFNTPPYEVTQGSIINL